MKTFAAILALALASCTTMTHPDGTQVQSISPLGAELIIRAADVAETKILGDK